MLLFHVSEGGNPSVQLSVALSSLRAIRGSLGLETILGCPPWQNTVKSWKEMEKKNNRMVIIA